MPTEPAPDTILPPQEDPLSLLAHYELALQIADLIPWEWNLLEPRASRIEEICALYTGPERPDIPDLETLLTYVHPDDRDWLAEATYAALAGQPMLAVEFRVLWTDGSLHWIESRASVVYDERGHPARMVGISRNIDHRKQEEERLRRNEHQFRTMFERAAVGIVVADFSGQILQANQVFCAIIGYTEAELQQKTIQDITYPDDMDGNLVLIRQLQAGSISGYVLQKRYMRRDGTLVWAQLSVSALRDAQGRPTQMMALCEDITEQKRALSALKAGEERLRYSLEAAQMLSWDWNLLTDQSHYSQDYGAFFGQEGNAGQGVAEATQVIHPEDRAKVLAASKYATETGEEYRMEFRGIPSDTGERWFSSQGRVTEDENGKRSRLTGVTWEITERRRMEQALRESEERWQFALEGSESGVWDWSIQTNEVYLSPRWKRMLGYRDEELPNVKGLWEQLVHPEDLASAQEALDRHLRGETSLYTTEHRIRCKDGSYKWILDRGKIVSYTPDGKPRRFVGTHTDITEQKRQALLLEQTQTTAQIGGWELDCLTEKLQWTAETYRIHETTPEEYTPTVETAIAFYRGDSRGRIEEAVRWAIESGEPYDMELEVTTAKGRPISVRSTGRVEQENSNTVRLYGVFQDITEWKRLQEQYLHAQKMESIGRLAGGIAHDFNNLLTAIIGYTELAQESLPGSPGYDRSLEQVKGAANRAAGLTRQLLAFARKQVIAPRPLQLDKLTDDLASLLRRLIGSDITLLTETTADLGTVNADPGQMEQVLVNMAVNARDAMPDGGILTIHTQNVVLTTPFSLAPDAPPPGEYVCLTVRDTGTGMEPSVKARLFEPFFTTKEVGKGTGLGLATCYGIVQQSGGFIQVETELGQGTTFQVYLPRVRQTETIATVDASVAKPQGSETILLVEDEPMVREFMEGALKSQGYRVLLASNGVEALEVARAADGPIHLLLTDIIMPQMNGSVLARQLREKQPDLRILFVSGYTDNNLLQADLEHGTAFLQKPYPLRKLIQTVRELLDSGDIVR